MYSMDNVHELYREITRDLIKNKLTITTMESCTSGFIASLITDTEGSSAVIKGAYVTYSNEAKIKNGVSKEIIDTYGVYSIETAEAMASTCRQQYVADIGIGITGTFGNVDPANNDSVPGEVYISVMLEKDKHSEKIILPVNISRFDSKLYVATKCADMIKEFCN